MCIQRQKQQLLTIFFLVFFLQVPVNVVESSDIRLPKLGDATSGIVSHEQEYLIGRTWLKAFRSRIKEYQDPMLKQYLEQLLNNLASHSQLEDPRLELVIVNNPTINAFAVPGGIIGVHTGIFIHAKTEDELSSILAHELAHLSQRHFARGIEAQRKTSLLSMGGLLAGLAIAAAAGADAGTAAMTVSQAAAMEGSLRYSRSNEQEADRIGLQTMRAANRNPRAAAKMFETMLSISRHSINRPPEFLLTHPVTEKRIADARNRTMNAPLKHYPPSEEYLLMQSRASVALNKNPDRIIQNFELKLRQRALNSDAISYGLALAYIKKNDFPQARRLTNTLIENHPEQLIYRYTDIEIDIASKHHDKAANKLQILLQKNPHSYPLLVLQAELFLNRKKYYESSEVLGLLTKDRPEDPDMWYRLAEVSGLAGDIATVHKARAEYFILVGAFDRARKQLSRAAVLLKHDFQQSAIIRQRLRDLASIEERVIKL